jgi:hypothetical protein
VATVVLASGVAAQSTDEIRTPFQLVPLWSQEMLDYLTGDRQVPCSGPPIAGCERLTPGICDDMVQFTFNPRFEGELPYRDPLKQSGSADPQYFISRLRNAAYSSRLFRYAAADFDRLELVFDCNVSGNTKCPLGRFQTGAVNRAELGRRGEPARRDLTHAAHVLPDGPIVIPLDTALKTSLASDVKAIYELRIAAECFSVARPPMEWSMPLHSSPENTPAIGALVARLQPEGGLEFAYRALDGKEVTFEPDWVERDWGYTFLMNQTILDRRGDWYRLPARPFPTAVWVRLPDREHLSQLEVGTIYRLSTPLKAVRTSTKRTVTLTAGTYVVVRLLDRALEIRKEEPADMACGDPVAPLRHNPAVYRVELSEIYDPDRHLRLTPAYTRGC